jgi:hypothetical protein
MGPGRPREQGPAIDTVAIPIRVKLRINAWMTAAWLFVPIPRRGKICYLFERMLLYMLYLCCVTGTDPAVLRAEAIALG